MKFFVNFNKYKPKLFISELMTGLPDAVIQIYQNQKNLSMLR